MTTVAIIATALIVVYLVGTYWKHRTLTSYAHWFDENLSSRGKVKFASHGHAGLRVRCETRRNGSPTEMHFALTLGARENLMYYPIAPFTRDFDKLNCWAILHKPIQSSVRIVKRSDRRGISSSEANPRLTAVKSDGLEELGYVMFASDRASALEVVSKASVPARLKATKGVEFIEIDKLSSRLHLVARLRKESLPGLVDFMFELRDAA